MGPWVRRVRGAVGMGLTWAVLWALTGILVGVASIVLPWLPWDAFFRVFDAPLPALAVPGFVGGAIFSVVLGVAGRRRRFDQLSLGRFAAWGALGGFLLSLVPPAMVVLGLATPAAGALGLWRLTVVVSGPLALLGAASAAGSLAVARAGEDRELLRADDDVADAGLTRDEVRELLHDEG